MRILVDKKPTDYTECMFARRYRSPDMPIGIKAMCMLHKSPGVPCVHIQKDKPECPFLIELRGAEDGSK